MESRLRKLILLILCLLSSGFAGWINGTGFIPFQFDSSQQFFIAERVASGVPPHLSQFSAKNSLSFLLHGAAAGLGRLFGFDDAYSVRGFDLLLLAISLYLTFVITLMITGNPVAAGFAFLSLLSIRGYIFLSAQGAEPKLLLIPFLLLSFLSLLKMRSVQLGFWTSCAFLCWQPVLLAPAIAVVVLFTMKERRNLLGHFFLGFLVPLAFYVLYFWIYDALGQAIFQCYVFAGRYMSHGIPDASWMMQTTIKMWKRATGLWNPLWIFLLFGIFIASVKIKSVLRNPAMLFLFLFFLAGLFFTIYEHQGFPDLLLILPAVPILAGYSFSFVWNFNDARWRTAARFFCALSAGLFVWSFWTGTALFPTSYTLAQQKALAKQVNVLQDRCGPVYAIGCAHLLAFNHQDNWSMYGSFFRGVNSYLATVSVNGPELDWDSRMLPPVILITRRETGNLPERFRQVLQQQFHQQDGAFENQEIQAWLRKHACKN